MPDLWPDDIGQSEGKAPVVILKEQAAALGRRTSNVVEARVTTRTMGSSGTGLLSYDFELVAPALDNYTYRLFTVSSGIELYPVKIYFLEQSIAGKTEPLQAESETQLEEILRRIFNSDKTKSIIGSLLAQSAGATPPPPLRM